MPYGDIMLTYRHPTIADVDTLLHFQESYNPEHRVGAAGGKHVDAQSCRLALQDWVTQHSAAITMAINADGVMVGGFGLFRADRDTIDAVLRGELPEEKIIPTVRGTVAYLSGVNVLPRYRTNRSVMHGLAAQISELLAELAPRQIFTQPATPEGLGLTKRFGFIQEPDQNIEHPLYSLWLPSASAARQLIGVAMVKHKIVGAAHDLVGV